MTLRLLAGALLCALFIPAANARPQHHIVDANKMVGCSDPVMRPCGGALNFEGSVGHHHKHLKRLANRSGSDHLVTTPISRRERAVPPGLRRVMAEGAGMVVGVRPAGCPRAFCGCGASLYLFGKIVPALNLAANWLRFPRAEPAPGMVAARRGHVFVLVRHIRGQVWLAHDSNSGRHRTRVHPRSIVGFAIVDPRA